MFNANFSNISAISWREILWKCIKRNENQCLQTTGNDTGHCYSVRGSTLAIHL